jgi:hypothetical protein
MFIYTSNLFIIRFDSSRIIPYGQNRPMFFVIHVVKSMVKSLIMLIYLLKMINNMNLHTFLSKPPHHHQLKQLRIYSPSTKNLFSYLSLPIYRAIFISLSSITFVQKTFHRVYASIVIQCMLIENFDKRLNKLLIIFY